MSIQFTMNKLRTKAEMFGAGSLTVTQRDYMARQVSREDNVRRIEDPAPIGPGYFRIEDTRTGSSRDVVSARQEVLAQWRNAGDSREPYQILGQNMRNKLRLWDAKTRSGQPLTKDEADELEAWNRRTRDQADLYEDDGEGPTIEKPPSVMRWSSKGDTPSAASQEYPDLPVVEAPPESVPPATAPRTSSLDSFLSEDPTIPKPKPTAAAAPSAAAAPRPAVRRSLVTRNFGSENNDRLLQDIRDVTASMPGTAMSRVTRGTPSPLGISVDDATPSRVVLASTSGGGNLTPAATGERRSLGTQLRELFDYGAHGETSPLSDIRGAFSDDRFALNTWRKSLFARRK